LNDLRQALAVNEDFVEWPDQVIKDAASDLRKALEAAVKAANVSCETPLRSLGKGPDLTYILNLLTAPTDRRPCRPTPSARPCRRAA
jgi:hypothetical protein